MAENIRTYITPDGREIHITLTPAVAVSGPGERSAPSYCVQGRDFADRTAAFDYAERLASEMHYGPPKPPAPEEFPLPTTPPLSDKAITEPDYF